MIESALIAALAPAAIDGVKSLFGGISRKFGGLSVDDEIKLMEANTNKLKGLAELDNPHGTPSQWVVDLRASFRYIACGVFIIGGLSTVYLAPTLAPLGLEAAATAASFIFGERMLLSLKK